MQSCVCLDIGFQNDMYLDVEGTIRQEEIGNTAFILAKYQDTLRPLNMKLVTQ